jgi:two-component system phosphate regulon response regulator PhoB
MNMLANAPGTAIAEASLTQRKHILIVEDELLIRDMVATALRDEGYEVSVAPTGQDAVRLLNLDRSGTPAPPLDLVILDLMLPQVNGLDLCRLLRQQNNPVPILILSAKASETDRVIGLEVGADDYLTKPFSMRELVARCRALLRRQTMGQFQPPDVLQHGELSLYSQECRVLVKGQEVALSPKEFRLLELFMKHPRRVWSRDRLLEQIWGMDFIGDSKTVDVHIRWLREKIEIDPSKPEYIVTVRGFGYRFG